MAFNASYDEGDITEATVDTIVKVFLTIGTLITVIVVVGIYTWVRKRL